MENESIRNEVQLQLQRLKKQIAANRLEVPKQNVAGQRNLFPVDVFPQPIRDIIIATNKDLNFPIDFIGLSLLYAASVAIGNTHKAELKKGFQESAVIYAAIVGPSGTNKSHPLHFALQPIIDADKKSYKKYEEERKEYERLNSLPDKERKKLGIEGSLKPNWYKHLVSDFTPEALTQVHKINKRGIGVYIDELAGWFKNFNRYNKGSEMEFWLSAWNSKPINIDRKTGDPVFINLPFISVIGTIQNGLLTELAKESRTQNGFIDRILFAIPDNLQKQYWNDSELDNGIVEKWNRVIKTILDFTCQFDETESPKPLVLKFNTEAKKLLFEWQRSNTDQSNAAENEAIRGIHSKLEMYAIRLSLILEMLSWACNESGKHEISVESTNGALRLVEYFREAAIKVYGIISNSSPLDNLSSLHLSIYRNLPEVFVTADGVRYALSQGMPERTFKRFINSREYFNKLRRGEYEKLL